MPTFIEVTHTVDNRRTLKAILNVDHLISATEHEPQVPNGKPLCVLNTASSTFGFEGTLVDLAEKILKTRASSSTAVRT